MIMAESLAKAGYYVHPVSIRLDERGKKQPDVPGTWKDSTREPDPAVFVTYGGVIIDCEKSGIVVIDLDVSEVKNGVEALAEAGIELPESPFTVETWSGGEHRYFRQPAQPLSSGQGVPVAGVDIRGIGGIVFGPRTKVENEDGSTAGIYHTDRGVKVEDLPVLPAEFAQAVRDAGTGEYEGSATLQPFTGELSDRQRATLEVWLEADLQAVAEGTDGNRHRVLLAQATKIVDRGNKLGYSDEQVDKMVQKAYEDSGGTEWDEKRAVLDWARRNAQAEPMGVPPDHVDPSQIEFEAKVQERVREIEIRNEAIRRVKVGSVPVSVGRELSFQEPEGSLYGQYWVKGVLPKGETVILFGERYHGKSVFGLDLGLSVAADRSWHGIQTKAGNVGYLAGEGTIGLPARRRAWVEHHRTENPARLKLLDQVVQLGSPGSIKAYQEWIVENEIDLVVIDTLRRAARGLDIADPGVAQDMVELVDDLRSVRPGCTALVLHHPTKTNPTEPAGGGTLQDAVSVIHHLVKDEYGAMTLNTTKMKDGPDGEVGTYYLAEIGSSVVLTKQGPAGASPHPSPQNPFGPPDEVRRREDEMQ
jgi:hypothetical protein